MLNPVFVEILHWKQEIKYLQLVNEFSVSFFTLRCRSYETFPF